MNGWASKYIEQLLLGKSVQFRPRGNSMKGRIESGQLVTVVPNKDNLSIGDIVLCKVKGRQYLHIIKSIKTNEFLIGNNRGKTNGWTNINNIFGKVIKVGN